MIDKPEYADAWKRLNYLYLDCGLWDELNFQIGTRIMHQKLSELGIPHDFELFNDGHINVPYRYDISLPRLESAIRAS